MSFNKCNKWNIHDASKIVNYLDDQRLVDTNKKHANIPSQKELIKLISAMQLPNTRTEHLLIECVIFMERVDHEPIV